MARKVTIYSIDGGDLSYETSNAVGDALAPQADAVLAFEDKDNAKVYVYPQNVRCVVVYPVV